jgi:tRNA 2-thiouridine synthesizing protein A
MDPKHGSGAPEAADDRLDTTGLRCPEPLMLLRNRIRSLSPGATLHVVSTDAASVRDFEKFCHFMGHALLQRWDSADGFEFLIRKKDEGS